MTKFLSSLAILAAWQPLPVQAGWLTISNMPASNEIFTAVGTLYPLSLPGWGGTATVQAIGGGGSGNGLRLRGYNYFPASDFSEYQNNGLDPAGSDQFVFQTGLVAPFFHIYQFDFSGLTNGYLPAGSTLTIRDLDTSLEQMNLTAAQGGGFTPVTSAWLQFVNQFDANGSATATGLNATAPSDFATYSFTGGTANFTAPLTNTDIPTLHFVTTQNLSRITFQGLYFGVNRDISLAIATPGQAPEPATFGMAAAVLGLAALRRWRGSRVAGGK